MAIRWKTETIARIDSGANFVEYLTLEAAIEKYLHEVTTTKAGGKAIVEFETSVFTQVRMMPFVAKKLNKITNADIKFLNDYWKITRNNKAATVNRKLTVLSNLFTIASTKWDMDGLRNPCKSMAETIPVGEVARHRDFKDDEENRLMIALDACLNKCIKYIVIIAIETGQRRREVLENVWKNIHDDRVFIPAAISKTRKPRWLPLSPDATAAYTELQNIQGSTPDAYVYMNTLKSFIEAWKKTKTRAKLADFHFHDLRHIALTRLSKIYPRMQDLARISGHSKLETLLIYYNEDIDHQVHAMNEYYNEV